MFYDQVGLLSDQPVGVRQGDPAAIVVVEYDQLDLLLHRSPENAIGYLPRKREFRA